MRAAAPPEPDARERDSLRGKVIEHTELFLDKIHSDKAFFKDHTDGADIRRSQPGEEVIPIEDIIQRLKTDLDEDGINPASGGHLGYIPGGGIYASSLADYWAAITNRYAGVFFANPGAVRIENKLIR